MGEEVDPPGIVQATRICPYRQMVYTCCKQQKVTEWDITKTEVGNEMEIFITLTKYNTLQQHEEGKPLLVYYLINCRHSSV